MVLTKEDKHTKAAEAFAAVAKGRYQILGVARIPELLAQLESQGLSTCDDEEKHRRAIEAISSVWTYKYQEYCEMSRALKTKEYSGKVITSEAFLEWYWNTMLKDGDSDGDGDGDEESGDDSAAVDRAEGLAEAEEAFNAIAKGSNFIPVSSFSELWCKLNKGLPYCEEQHSRTLKKISEYVKVIPRQAFLDSWSDWYQAEAEEKFDEIAQGSNHIATTDFPNLLETMGVVNRNSSCEKIDNISEEVKVIARQDFLDWYGWYIFED